MFQVRIGIVEDTKDDLDRLKSFLERFGKEQDVEFTISSFMDAVSFLDEYNFTYDVLLLDIELDKDNGIDVARKIREKDKEVIIIFETNIAKFAIKGYEVDAMDYMLKPITYPSLSLRLMKAISLLKKNAAGGELNIELGNYNIRRISLKKLLYIEVRGHTVLYHLKNETIEARGSMKNVESRLKDQNFSRCNNCYLVNLSLVQGIDKNECLVGGERILISRPRKKEFSDSFMNYILNSREE